MTSLSLRKYLSRVHGVEVGSYSYGSLLKPGGSDRGLTIGRYVSIGPGVRRFGAAHPVDKLSMHPFWYNPALGVASPDLDVERSACVIEDDVWIGAGATILPGCERIGMGAVIGAGSVVTRDVPDFAVVTGVPARVRGRRFDEATREALHEARPWQLEPKKCAVALQAIADEMGDPTLFFR